MSNLLPESNKKKIKIEYTLRVVGVALIFLAITLFFISVSLIPSYFLSENKTEIVEERIESLKSYIKKRQESGANRILFDTNEKLFVLDKSEDLKISKLIKSIVDEKNSSILITAIILRDVGEENKSIFINGDAASRDDLLSFRESIESTDLFSEVNLPISNLAKNKDINFNLEIKLRNKSK